MIKEVRCLFVTLTNQVYRLNKKKKNYFPFNKLKHSIGWTRVTILRNRQYPSLHWNADGYIRSLRVLRQWMHCLYGMYEEKTNARVSGGTNEWWLWCGWRRWTATIEGGSHISDHLDFVCSMATTSYSTKYPLKIDSFANFLSTIFLFFFFLAHFYFFEVKFYWRIFFSIFK